MRREIKLPFKEARADSLETQEKCQYCDTLIYRALRRHANRSAPQRRQLTVLNWPAKLINAEASARDEETPREIASGSGSCLENTSAFLVNHSRERRHNKFPPRADRSRPGKRI